MCTSFAPKSSLYTATVQFCIYPEQSTKIIRISISESSKQRYARGWNKTIPGLLRNEKRCITIHSLIHYFCSCKITKTKTFARNADSPALFSLAFRTRVKQRIFRYSSRLIRPLVIEVMKTKLQRALEALRTSIKQITIFIAIFPGLGLSIKLSPGAYYVIKRQLVK